jgi:hypothetical protein
MPTNIELDSCVPSTPIHGVRSLSQDQTCPDRFNTYLLYSQLELLCLYVYVVVIYIMFAGSFNPKFRTESVSQAGKNWEERFDHLIRQFPSPHVLSNKEEVPSWLSLRPNYNSWERANLWLIQEALAVGSKNITLLALWDGKAGDGPGGTDHMIRVAAHHGAATVILDTNKLFQEYIGGRSES